ncbi:uncharacterized protein LOC142331801 isoform X2 [Lycorma delicatula]|uniref:uncharacterized protein LOC142331801 isoform X2 n=1 Tax=Lycorma delicatula TaxID=130591 RepID=UPI003F50D803
MTMFCSDDCFSVLFTFKKRLRRRSRQSNMDNDQYNNNNNTQISNNINSLRISDITEGDQEATDSTDVKLVPVFPTPIPINQVDLLHDWMRRARKYQQGHYNSLGDRIWDLIETEDMLEKKIGFAMYGMPIENIKMNALGYNAEQIQQITLIKLHILTLWNKISAVNNKGNIYFNCIFVYLRSKDDGNKEGVDVLFRIPKIMDEDLSNYLFIDTTCRTYDGFNDYLKNNKLPKCDMCYPLNGIYSANSSIVEIDFKESPACNISKSVLKGLDITTSVLTLGATGVSIAALAIPVAAPFIWGATATILASGAYDITRYVSKLIDIKQHYESLSLKNPESRGAWIGLAATAVGVASVGGTAISRGVMATEQIIGRSSAVTLRIINMSSIAINGVGVLNSLITIVMKYLNGTLERNDVLQFTSACYFFLNAIVSLNVADRLIKDIASSDITDLFHTTKNCAFNFTKSAIEFTDSSTYNLLRALVLGAQSRFMPEIDLNYLEMSIHKIISLLNQMSKGSISWSKFTIEISELLQNIWFKFRYVILKSIDELTKIFKIKDWKSYVIKSSGYKPFAQSSPDIARQFCVAIYKTIDYCNLDDTNVEYINDVLILINEFNILYPSDNAIDFLNKCKFICESFIKEFDNIKEEYEMDLDSVKMNATKNNEKFDVNDFDKNYGIEGDKNIYFFKKTLRKLQTENMFKNIYTAYHALTENCIQSFCETPCMETNVSSHFVFSGPSGRKSLTDQQYWQKAKDVTNVDLNKDNSTMLQQKDLVLIRPNNNNIDIKAVIFYSTYEKGSVMGIVSVLKNIPDNFQQQ